MTATAANPAAKVLENAIRDVVGKAGDANVAKLQIVSLASAAISELFVSRGLASVPPSRIGEVANAAAETVMRSYRHACTDHLRKQDGVPKDFIAPDHLAWHVMAQGGAVDAVVELVQNEIDAARKQKRAGALR